jgi:hypothetical protein
MKFFLSFYFILNTIIDIATPGGEVQRSLYFFFYLESYQIKKSCSTFLKNENENNLFHDLTSAGSYVLIGITKTNQKKTY